MSEEISNKKIRDNIEPGMEIRLKQRIHEKDAYGNENERTQIFEGTVISRKHGTEKGATMTIRKVVSGVGVEKIYPIYSPIIEEIEILKNQKVRQSQPYYLRDQDKKLKEEEIDIETA
ncbi:MAG: 50S ribosomal protein L19 [Candidatus Magasanikbacteria bacterium]